MAEAIAARESDDDAPAPTPPLSEWTPTVSHLAKISDQIQALRIAVIAGNGGKAPHFSPEPRPVTEVERAGLRRELKHHDDLVAEVMAAQERWEQNQEREGAADA